MSIVGEVASKKLGDLREQTETTLFTLIEGEMCTVFTNDANYLSARDDLLAVIVKLLRKLLIVKERQNRSSSVKSGKDWTDILELLSMFLMILSLKLLDSF